MARHKTFDDLDVSDDFVLPDGNAVRGGLLFKKHCSQCHTIRRDGLNPYGTLAGPNLYGVMGRTAAQNQRTGWSKYSTSLEESGILWTERNMMAFLKNPRAFAGGVINMNFRGIDSFKDRIDIIHYLKRAGHESWMVQDGTPHSQRNWWSRGEKANGSQSYWEANATNKQLKPWEHVTRAISAKVSEVTSSATKSLGVESPPDVASGKVAPSGATWAIAAQDDPEVKSWRKVAKVADGVHAASMQQSFNWPLPEEISAGPVRKGAVAAAPASADRVQAFAGAVVACEERSPTERRCPALPGGERAPSGLMVYPDHGGPASRPRAAAPAKL